MSDAVDVIEENGDQLPLSTRFGSLERQFPLSTGGGQILLLSQKGKKDTFYFTLGVSF